MGLKKVNIKDWRDLAPLEGWCRVISVYDGDTIWVVLNPTDPTNLNVTDDQLRQVNIRLARIDAPEMKGGSAEEKQKGKQSRDYVRSLIDDKVVWFKFGNYGLYNGESLDCYHRQIGEIYVSRPISAVTGKYEQWFGGDATSINLSDHLMQYGYATHFVPQ